MDCRTASHCRDPERRRVIHLHAHGCRRPSDRRASWASVASTGTRATSGGSDVAFMSGGRWPLTAFLCSSSARKSLEVNSCLRGAWWRPPEASPDSPRTLTSSSGPYRRCRIETATSINRPEAAAASVADAEVDAVAAPVPDQRERRTGRHSCLRLSWRRWKDLMVSRLASAFICSSTLTKQQLGQAGRRAASSDRVVRWVARRSASSAEKRSAPTRAPQLPRPQHVRLHRPSRRIGRLLLLLLRHSPPLRPSLPPRYPLPQRRGSSPNPSLSPGPRRSSPRPPRSLACSTPLPDPPPPTPVQRSSRESSRLRRALRSERSLGWSTSSVEGRRARRRRLPRARAIKTMGTRAMGWTSFWMTSTDSRRRLWEWTASLRAPGTRRKRQTRWMRMQAWDPVLRFVSSQNCSPILY